MGKRILLAVAAATLAVPAFAVDTKDTAAGGVTADQIAQALTGPGVTITNAKITGAAKAIGTFTGGGGDGFAIDSGVIMSTGDIATAKGPNDAQGTTGALGTAGDATLDSLVAPYKTQDAVIFEFDAVTVSSTFSIKYIFASEEYKEYVGSQFNDVFAFFVDGQNIAIVPGSGDPVSVNTINHLTNTGLYRDNPPGSNAFGTSFDGFTTELTAFATVTPGATHHIRLAIADASDALLDSAVYLAQGGISGLGAATIVTEANEVLVSNLDTNDMKVTVYGVPDDVTPVLSASGLPDDSTVTFTPAGSLGANTPVYKMHIAVGPDTIAGEYPLTIRAGLGATGETFAHVQVIVDCQPPMILNTPGNQPASTSVANGSTTTLRVVPVGTGGFRYQWYEGHRGNTRSPISGATSATLTTPAIKSDTEFWVRVTNACGSVDSATAAISVR